MGKKKTLDLPTISQPCGAWKVERTEASTPSGFTNVRRQCTGLATGTQADQYLKCPVCGAEQPNPNYDPDLDKGVHVKKRVE
jgi:hypothetical protein